MYALIILKIVEFIDIIEEVHIKWLKLDNFAGIESFKAHHVIDHPIH